MLVSGVKGTKAKKGKMTNAGAVRAVNKGTVSTRGRAIMST